MHEREGRGEYIEDGGENLKRYRKDGDITERIHMQSGSERNNGEKGGNKPMSEVSGGNEIVKAEFRMYDLHSTISMHFVIALSHQPDPNARF